MTLETRKPTGWELRERIVLAKDLCSDDGLLWQDASDEQHDAYLDAAASILESFK